MEPEKLPLCSRPAQGARGAIRLLLGDEPNESALNAVTCVIPLTRMNAGRAGGGSCGLKDLLTEKMGLSQGAERAASRGRSASPVGEPAHSPRTLGGNSVLGGSPVSRGALVQPQGDKVPEELLPSQATSGEEMPGPRARLLPTPLVSTGSWELGSDLPRGCRGALVGKPPAGRVSV